ncbi:MAG: efflux RND transporter periplasmic adaptor subunit [Bacteroidales bacterium]|nr:efflux RND transporter periplasmic adaptor subunit [Bacteroidales bacterium]
MRKIDRRIVIVVSVIFIIGLAYGLMKFLVAQKEPPPVRRSIEARRYVKVEPVKYSTISSSVSASGRLASVAEIDIVAEASGKIETGSIALKKGAGFSKGDVLFIVYPDEALLSLKARKSQYQNTLASILPDLSIDFPQHEEAFHRFFSSISFEKPLPSIPEVKDDKLKIFLASRNVISEYYNIQRDELQLSRRTVTAPFNGTYKEVYMELGAYTNIGGKVARAIRTDELELEVPLDPADAAWININDPVSVSSENRSLTWDGRVIRKSRFVDENTQSQEIFIRIPYNNRQPLMAGEYLAATFPVRPIENVMEIPRNSVFNSNEVFQVQGSRLIKKEINVIKVNERTLIFNGLQEGDTLVVQQLINVSEGTLVQVDKGSAKQGQIRPGNPGKQPAGPEEMKKENSDAGDKKTKRKPAERP